MSEAICKTSLAVTGPVCLFGDGVLRLVTVNGIQLTEAGKNETTDFSEIDDSGLDYD